MTASLELAACCKEEELNPQLRHVFPGWTKAKPGANTTVKPSKMCNPQKIPLWVDVLLPVSHLEGAGYTLLSFGA